MEGLIYILKRADRPELCKVGKTINKASSRAREYTDGKWEPASEFPAPPYLLSMIEEKAHSILKEGGYWLDPATIDGSAREIFLCDLSAAESAVTKAFKYASKTIQEDARILETLTMQHDSEVPKKKIQCPNCYITLRIPSDRRVKFTCPSCGKKYVNNNFCDPKSGKQNPYWTEA